MTFATPICPITGEAHARASTILPTIGMAALPSLAPEDLPGELVGQYAPKDTTDAPP